jgi:hypothetical protein
MGYKLEFVFMYNPFVKRGAASLRRFRHKFHNTTPPQRITIDETVDKLK